MQIGGGVEYLFGIKNNFKLQIAIIIVITIIYIYNDVQKYAFFLVNKNNLRYF